MDTLMPPGAIVEKEGPRQGFVISPPRRPDLSARTPAKKYPSDEDLLGLAPHGESDYGDHGDESRQNQNAGTEAGATTALGPNNERLADTNPRAVSALRDLMLQFRSEGLVARRHEVRRIKQARLFWQGLQYAWWNPGDMSWHLPFESQDAGDKSLQEMPRYQFVTNLYQAFGLSFIALISQDVPATRFYPQSAQIEIDVAAARAASDVAALIEENNKVQQMLTGVGYFLWTDGKIGGYVRYVADAQRFGWHDEDIIEEARVRLGDDAYVCPQCGEESAVAPACPDPDANQWRHPEPDTIQRRHPESDTNQRRHPESDTNQRRHPESDTSQRRHPEPGLLGEGYPALVSQAGVSSHENPAANESISFGANSAPRLNSSGRETAPQDDVADFGRTGDAEPPANYASTENAALINGDSNDPVNPRPYETGQATNSQPNFLTGTTCPHCGAQLNESHFRPAPVVTVPRITGTRRVPNGQEVITILGGLELNTPVWANEMHEFPYLQWQQEVHLAKLRAAYPHAADKIILGGPVDAEDVYARASRVAVAQGLPTTQPGDALFNLITFTRTWIRPWAFYAIEDKQTRAELLQLFPEGCYVAFAGETYCESRNETLDDHWRVMHALPGDGQNRPSVGDSLVQIQERYNTLSNIQAETYEFGIPPIYADPQVLDFDALSSQTAEPAAHYPARAKPGQPLAASFFQPAPAQVPADMLEHQQDLAGPISQFLTGLFPAVFGGVQANTKTAAGYAMARDQALGRLGLVWRRLKQFYADLMLLSVDTFRKNRASDVEIPLLGAAGEFESKWIRLADLKGNIQAHPESDESFPRQKSQQRAVLQQLLNTSDPLITQALSDPENIGYIKNIFGLNELVVPGEDAREKQLREIAQLLASAPIVVPVPAPDSVARPRFVGAGPLNFSESPSSGAESPTEPGTNENIAVNNGESTGPVNPRPYETGQATNSTPPPAEHDSPHAPTAPPVHFIELPSVPIDELLDDHAAELAEIRRWASSDAGQIARAQNPLGFANVRAHASAHQSAIARQSAQAAQQQAAAAAFAASAKRGSKSQK